jgi:signal transduction histidine kinase
MAEKEHTEAEGRYRSLFEEAPVSLWEEDFTEVRGYLDQLRSGGVEDLKGYLQNNPGALGECATRVKVLDVNKCTLELYGARSKQEFFENLSGFFCDESYPFFIEEVLAIANGETAFEGETVNKTLQGGTLDIFLKWIVPSGNLEKYSRVIVSIVDITERRAFERALQETNEQLKHFLNVAAHEIRHPISLVYGYAKTLSEFRQELSEEELSEVYQGIEVATGRITLTVSELFEASRIERDRFHMGRTRAEVAPLLCEVVEEMQKCKPGHCFEVRVEAGAGSCMLDEEKVQRLMIILLDNAVKYSPDGSLVEIELGFDGENLHGAVLDRGSGVSGPHRELIFDRFYQEGEPQSQEGLGLGLHIAREIVGGHGGRIWCEPRDGGGSVFRFFLPAS